nr:ATP-binding protein [Pyrobaculum islandicum]
MYLRRFDASLPFWENVRREFFTKGGFLYEEAEFLLRQELREPRNYFLVLRAIADGRRRLGEIASEAGLDKAAASRYLATLELLDLVGHEVPVLEPPKARRRLYFIRDNYLAFWFAHVQPRRGSRGRARRRLRRPGGGSTSTCRGCMRRWRGGWCRRFTRAGGWGGSGGGWVGGRTRSIFWPWGRGMPSTAR